MIGVHSPEFDHEKQRDVVQRVVTRFGLDQPIYMDNDHAFWDGLGNRYWPAFYLIDRSGRVRLGVVGEMHEHTERANRFNDLIEALLAEKPAGTS